jgi:hypothetical protein
LSSSTSWKSYSVPILGSRARPTRNQVFLFFRSREKISNPEVHHQGELVMKPLAAFSLDDGQLKGKVSLELSMNMKGRHVK